MKQSKPRPKTAAKPKPDTRSAQFVLIGQIVDYMNARGFFVWHQSNTGRFDTDHAQERLVKLVTDLRLAPNVPKSQAEAAVANALAESWRKVPHTAKGVPDIIGMHHSGIFVAVEVKIGSDRLSDDQRGFLARIQEMGGRAVTVGSFAEFQRLFTSKKPAPAAQAVPGESRTQS